jgi:TrpR-related protein YerC/YecD
VSFEWENQEMRELFETIADINDPDTVAAFMRDVATIRELREMSARWRAAQMIQNGTSYRDIARETGLSTTTVGRVAYWINYGMGGYKKMLKNSIHHSATKHGNSS